MGRRQRTATYDFTASVSVVTGAAGDLGRAVVDRLARAGADVVAIDRDPRGLDALVSSLEGLSGRVIARTADVRDAAQIADAVAAVDGLGAGGRVDMLFNNAGVEGRVATIDSLTVADMSSVWDVNVAGILNGLSATLPRMTTGGAVVNTASTAALAGSPGLGAYVASKHAVLGLTRTAAAEVAERGIRVNAVCPGPIEGRMMSSLDDQRTSVLHVDPHAGRTYATAGEIADVVMFLLSAESELLTGQAITAARS